MAVKCGECGLELPMRPGPFTTCPRCVREPEVARRIAAELVEAALARSGSEAALVLLSSAEAWRAAARVGVGVGSR